MIYRLLEILPGAFAWTTIIFTISLSFVSAPAAAIFIIVFDIYWLSKTLYLSFFLRRNWKRLKTNMKRDWAKLLEKEHYSHIYQMVILPFYNEPDRVIEDTLKSLEMAQWDKKKMIVVLAGEASSREVEKRTEYFSERYKNIFGYFLTTIHTLENSELQGKGSNIAYAARKANELIIEKYNINPDNVLVSAFDIDTVAHSQYFLALTWNFLNTPERYNHSYQPVPLYNNNIWNAPAFSRVVATSGTFWQMVQQERPDRMSTFSSHALPLSTLKKINYWQKNIVSEDSRIFWNAFLAHDGDYRVRPLSYPVSMDANLAHSMWQTAKNVYKQQRRWGYGVENVPYILIGFIKNKKISLRQKIKLSIAQIEGFWSLSTHPLIIFILGWLPLIVGSEEFNTTLISYNLPIITRYLMTFSAVGLIISAIISLSFLTPRPKERPKYEYIIMAVQWLLVPFTLIIFGAIPALEAQTRLMLGKYMGFWVTPKERK